MARFHSKVSITQHVSECTLVHKYVTVLELVRNHAVLCTHNISAAVLLPSLCHLKAATHCTQQSCPDDTASSFTVLEPSPSSLYSRKQCLHIEGLLHIQGPSSYTWRGRDRRGRGCNIGRVGVKKVSKC